LLRQNQLRQNQIPTRLFHWGLFFLTKTSPRYSAGLSIEFPPMSDLESQLLFYYEKMCRDIEDLNMNPNFSDGVESLYRDANVFILIALVIGKSPEESQYKTAVVGLIEAAQKINFVSNKEEAKEAVEKTKEAFQSQNDPSMLKWEKVAHLSPIMKKALPSMTTEIKRLSRNEKTFRREANTQKILGASAALAVVAIGCRPNVDETLAPNEEELWQSYCDKLYSRAIELNKVAHQVHEEKIPFETFSAAFKEIDSTCNTTCHEKFGGQTN
ncbi:MAG: hypothetical protein Q4C95_10440, partial [Planctomycetia bacterium]|nr:hypothetical protein [Planctomycetia bacterium]